MKASGRELMAMQRSRRLAAGEVRRARLVLLLDEGLSREAIKRELGCDSRFISTWGGRFAANRLAGLYGRHPGRWLDALEQPQAGQAIAGAVAAFLAEHPPVTMHFTPTYSSWLNQVGNWFARIQRDVIVRGVFTSTEDLEKKLMRYIRQYNNSARPLTWKYADPTRRIRCNSSGSVD